MNTPRFNSTPLAGRMPEEPLQATERVLAPDNPRTDPGNGSSSEDVCVFPMTAAQRRFWLLDQLKPGNPALNVPLAARLTGRLDRATLHRAVNEILRRHEILRTSFRTLNEEVVQIVHAERVITLEWHDLSAHPPAERETQVHRLMLEEGARSFELSQGPLLRGGLIKVQDDEHVLMLTVHHIGCDGWSNGIIMREVAEIYTSLLTGEASLPELPLQYADFAQWQNDWLASPAAARQCEFWKRRLRGNLPVLNVPTDRPRKPGRSHAGTIETLLLPQPLRDRLMSLCTRENVTPFMLFFATYAILLYRYTGEPDLIIGCPAANRSQTDLEGLIGLFSNPLVMRLDLSGKPTFRELLARVTDLSLEAFDHQAYPFEKLLEEVQTDTHRLGSQWLRFYFIFQKAFMQPQQMPHLTLTPLRSISPGAMFEWTLGVLERAEGIRLQLEYNTDLFDQSTIQRLLRQFQHVLETAVLGLNVRIDDLTVMPAEEHRQVVIDWNQTQCEVPREWRLHQLFEKQAQVTPDAPAVCSRKSQLSYLELNTRANKLAHHLRALGVNQDCRVGLAVDERSAEFLAGFLAILKVGGCVVALDRQSSDEQLSGRIRASGLTALLTESSLPAMLRPEGLRLVCFDTDAGAVDRCPGGNLSDHSQAEQPACILFSSGRSAPPKGAIISHRALLNGSYAAMRELGLLRQDRVGFSKEEMLPALLAGAALVLPPVADEFSPEAWLQWVKSQRLTVAALPTPCWHEVVHTLARARRPASGQLRLMIVGGCRISPLALSEWRRATANRIRLLDRYLLAETAGAAAFCEPCAADELSAGVSTFRPAANTRLYLLDANLQPVPIGVPGDLYVGGESLASGYWGGSTADAAAFVEDRFSDRPGERLSKTGDLGRFLARGGIELVARVEDLAQTHGFRLELSEICSVLSRHPAVWDVLVVPREDADQKNLVAYVVGQADAPLSRTEMKAFAEKHLPDYMVPSSFVVLKRLPLTRNGDVDRAQLPAPDLNQTGLAESCVAPRTVSEQKLSNLWSEVLGLKQPGVRDNFFESGGDSLLAIRLASKIKRELKFDLPARALFQHPTIEKLAAVLSARNKMGRAPELIPLHAGDSGLTLVLLIGTGSLELFNLAHLLPEDTTVYGSIAPLPEPILEAAAKKRLAALPRLEDMAAPHAALIRELAPSGPLLLSGFCFGGTLAFEVAHQLQRDGRQVAGVVLLDTWMTRPSLWWRKKTWFAGHVRNAVRKGPLYVWRKFRSRVDFEKDKIAAERQLNMSNNFGGEMPWAVTERIYKQAMFGYCPRPLASRGVLLSPGDDWMVNSYRQIDESLGAGSLFSGGVEVLDVPGNHVNILRASNLPEVARCYGTVLKKFLAHAPFEEERGAPKRILNGRNLDVVR